MLSKRLYVINWLPKAMLLILRNQALMMASMMASMMATVAGLVITVGLNRKVT